jgi:ATP-dependent DNA helicase RecG
VNLNEIRRLVATGEGSGIEFKRTTGELQAGLQTACAFLNGDGGTVVFGVAPDGKVLGQEISDQTLRELAQMLERFEPPPRLSTGRIPLKDGREVLTIKVKGNSDNIPFTFE